MDEDKIKGYICCGLEKHPSGVMYIKMALGMNIIYILEIFICVVKGGALFGLGMIVLGIAFASTLIAVILSFRISLVKRIAVSCILGTAAVINLALFCLMFCFILETPLWVKVLVFSFPFFCSFASIFVMRRSIKNGAFLKVRPNKMKSLPSFVAFGVVGMGLGRLLFSGKEATAGLVVLTVLVMLVAVIFSTGMADWLKLYYIHKLSLEDADLWPLIADDTVSGGQ